MYFYIVSPTSQGYLVIQAIILVFTVNNKTDVLFIWTWKVDAIERHSPINHTDFFLCNYASIETTRTNKNIVCQSWQITSLHFNPLFLNYFLVIWRRNSYRGIFIIRSFWYDAIWLSSFALLNKKNVNW